MANHYHLKKIVNNYIENITRTFQSFDTDLNKLTTFEDIFVIHSICVSDYENKMYNSKQYRVMSFNGKG